MFIYFLDKVCVRNPRNPSVNLSPTLGRNEKIEYHIRMRTHPLIVLRFWLRVVLIFYVIGLKSH